MEMANGKIDFPLISQLPYFVISEAIRQLKEFEHIAFTITFELFPGFEKLCKELFNLCIFVVFLIIDIAIFGSLFPWFLHVDIFWLIYEKREFNTKSSSNFSF